VLPESAQQRFWSKVALPNEQGCMLWTGYITSQGYGRLSVRRRMMLAHRVSYELTFGLIPDGLPLDHLCRTPACVAPLHLEPVTQRENTLRGVGPAAVNARKTHCPQGHPYNEANTYLFRGSRNCRICHQATVIRCRARKKGES
jgi:hypothetical protein